MVKLTAKVTESWIKANERAYANRQAGRVVRWVAPNTYEAPSSKGDGTVYTVRILNVGQLLATCTCPHGAHGTAGHCWHCSAALCAEVRRISDPTSPEAVASRQYRPAPLPPALAAIIDDPQAEEAARQARRAEMERKMARFARQ